VFVHRGEAAAAVAARMAGHALAAQQQLHPAAREPCFQALADQGVRDAVAVAFDLNVVINVFCSRLQNTFSVALQFLWPWQQGVACRRG
jgi:hypothetical protein